MGIAYRLFHNIYFSIIIYYINFKLILLSKLDAM
jgi:hypothetical protein